MTVMNQQRAATSLGIGSDKPRTKTKVQSEFRGAMASVPRAYDEALPFLSSFLVLCCCALLAVRWKPYHCFPLRSSPWYLRSVPTS